MKISKVKVTAFLIASIYLISTGVFSLYRLYRLRCVMQMIDPKYDLDEIVQTGPERESLPSVYLAELLDLSIDKPGQYFIFDQKEAEEKLLKSPVIKKAHVVKLKPNKVYVDYAVRRPVAFLKDFTNTAIDEDGYLLPMRPFFSPKRLTKVFIGIKEPVKKLEGKEWELAHQILKEIEKLPESSHFFVELIDVSQINHESFGKREIVLKVDLRGKIDYLRLGVDGYKERFINYLGMTDKEKLPLETNSGTIRVIDLRIKDLAYVENYPQS